MVLSKRPGKIASYRAPPSQNVSYMMPKKPARTVNKNSGDVGHFLAVGRSSVSTASLPEADFTLHLSKLPDFLICCAWREVLCTCRFIQSETKERLHVWPHYSKLPVL